MWSILKNFHRSINSLYKGCVYISLLLHFLVMFVLRADYLIPGGGGMFLQKKDCLQIIKNK